MIRAILTDIEGTTTSVSFVYEVLFPYARQHLADFVRAHVHEFYVRQQLEAVSVEVGKALDDEAAIAQLLGWMDEDHKVGPLKVLQGKIWKQGYEQGDFTGHVYADAVNKLRKWQQQGLRLYVYSSGSAAAQQLLFGHSDAGDLRPLFSGYFDTRMGGKREVVSYQRIAREIGLSLREILFLSDIREELDAAREAGMHTRWLLRDETTPLTTQTEHPQVRDFSGIGL